MKKKYILPVLLIIFCIFLIIMIQKKINQVRLNEKIAVYTSAEDLPPGIAFVNVGLGAFKGIFSDILWLKAISLQEQGKYFEMGKIAFWITKLNPQFTGATTFLAWNMAYNISIMYADPKDKWKWVENAIDVLEEAIQYNPNAPDLYKELAWIYLNKIGDVFDSGNLYYKTQIAFRMQNIIGENTPGSFWNSLLSNNNDELSLKKEQIKKSFMLDPKYIIEVNNKFGNLDWRVSQSLAIYWAYKGSLIEGKYKECFKPLMMSLMAYAYNGKLLFFDESDYSDFTSMPDFIMIERMNSYFKKQIASEDRDSYANLYYTFLNKTLEECCLFGRLNLAKKLFSDMKTHFTKVSYSDFDKYFKNYIQNYLSGKNGNDFVESLREHLRIATVLSLKTKEVKYSEDIINMWKSLFDSYQKLNPLDTLSPFEKYFDEEKSKYLKAERH